MNTVDGFIFVGTNFRGLNKNCIFVGIKIRGYYIFLHKSYRKSLFRWFWNSWKVPVPSTKNHKKLAPKKIKPFTVGKLFDWMDMQFKRSDKIKENFIEKDLSHSQNLTPLR